MLDLPEEKVGRHLGLRWEWTEGLVVLILAVLLNGEGLGKGGSSHL